MKTKFLKGAGWLLNALLPRTCAHCGEDLHFLSADPLCPPCAGALEAVPLPCCSACGLPLSDGGAACPDCRGRKSPLSAARAALLFNGQARSLVHAIKYRGRDDLAPWLAARMAGELDRFPELAGYDFCLPVPLHPARLRERGYNQSELLADGLAALRNLFHLRGAAVRTRNTRSQAELSRKERLENMRGAFSVTAPELVRGRKILLIDDVATTLATLDGLAAALKDAGAGPVAALTLAREP